MLRKEVISGLIFRANIARLYNDRHGALNPLGGAHNDDLRPIVGFHRAKKQRLAYIDVGDADTGGIFKGMRESALIIQFRRYAPARMAKLINPTSIMALLSPPPLQGCPKDNPNEHYQYS